jgi:HK97 family phage major capsid protein
MKKKIAARRKAAWEAAKKDPAFDKTELSELEAEYKTAQKEADDEDKAAADGKAGAGNGDKGNAKADNIVELSEITTMITKAVEDGLAAKLPEALKAQVTADGVKKIVEDALAAANITDSKKITMDQVKAVVESATSEQIKALKLPSKMQHGKDDADAGNGKAGGTDDADRDMIEIPFALTKGNLPLHMKQLLNVLLRKPQDEGIDKAILTKGTRLGDNMFNSLRVQGCKALITTGTNTGAEWIPRDLSSELLRRLYLESRIAQFMIAKEIQMPTDPYDLPLSTTRPKFFRNKVQNREATASDPGTDKQTLTTTKLMALVQYSYEANEDSIIPLIPLLQTLIGEAAAAALESAIINGDTTATHQDTDTALEVDAVEKSWKGLRQLALAVAGLKVDLSTGGITRANLISIKKKLKKYGRNPRDLAWIIGTQAENDFLGLDDVALWQNRGSAPTTATGEIFQYLGIPFLVSEAAREDLNASGVNDGVTTTKGSIILANLGYFLFGSRREFTVEVDRNIRSQTNDIVASFRKAFQPQETPSATVPTVAIGYNYNS